MLEIMGQLNDDASLYRYYYGKGALDLRDKIVEALTDLPFDAPGEVVRQTALSIFPDPFEEPGSNTK